MVGNRISGGTPLRRHGAPELAANDVSIGEAAGAYHQHEGKQQREICRDQEGGRGLGILQCDQQHGHKRGEESLPDRQIEYSTPVAVHGVLAFGM